MPGEPVIDRETPLVGVVAPETSLAGANGGSRRGLGLDEHIVFLGMPATDRAGPAGKKLTLNELKFDPLSFHFLPQSVSGKPTLILRPKCGSGPAGPATGVKS